MTDQEGRTRLESLLWIAGFHRRQSVHPSPDRQEPLRPFTLPNLISLIRLALIPVFLVTALGHRSSVGRDAIIIFGIAALSDYFDGLLARLLGQYSRLGVLMDPLVDRLLVVAAMAVTWHYKLLPIWAIAVVLAREVLMIAISRYALSRGLKIEVNWIGRAALWLIMMGAGLAMIDASEVSDGIFIAGMTLSVASVVRYVTDGKKGMKEKTAHYR